MLIELIGISGSGKSATAQKVMRSLLARGLRIQHIGSGYEWAKRARWLERAKDAAMGGVGAARNTAKLAMLSQIAGVRLGLKQSLSLFSLMGQNYRALQAQDIIFLSDQGLVQRIGSFSLRSSDESHFFSALDVHAMASFPWPISVIYLDLPPQIAFSRVRSRPGRLARLPDSDLRQLLNRSEKIVQEQAALVSKLGIPLQKISAHVEQAELAAQLEDSIRRIIEIGMT